MKGKFEMTKRFEKELAEAETILSNYEKNLAKYFDNPASYGKFVSTLMPVMQEQIKLIDDFRDSSIEIGIDEHSLHTIILPNDTDLNKFISLHLNDDGLVEVKIEDHVYHMSRYEAQLYGELTLVPDVREDKYGNDIGEYPFKLYSESLIDIDMLGTSLKLMLSKFDKSKTQFIKPIK